VSFPLHTVEELDSVPQLVSNNHVVFPRRMRENAIDKVATQVEIIIDAQGKAYVKKIVDPGYPEMVEVIRKAINDSRFTIPKKNGRPTQAVYLYKLTFINKV
jgi:periplasmic protein TonB